MKRKRGIGEKEGDRTRRKGSSRYASLRIGTREYEDSISAERKPISSTAEVQEKRLLGICQCRKTWEQEDFAFAPACAGPPADRVVRNYRGAMLTWTQCAGSAAAVATKPTRSARSMFVEPARRRRVTRTMVPVRWAGMHV